VKKNPNLRPTSPHALPTLAKARLAAHIEQAGLKHSRPRDAVVEAFLSCKGHISADELTAAVRRTAPRIGSTTVYRALKLLVDSGVAAMHQFGDGLARYERVLDDTHHDHLICVQCGTIVEFENPEIEELQAEVARRLGFEVTGHRLEITGRCSACARKDHLSASTPRRPVALRS
jgi:Fur family ferric uptake transcriptional regulator